MKRNFLVTTARSPRARPAFPLLGMILLTLLAFIACASGGPEALNPEKAVYALAPVQKLADSPNEGVYYCIFVRSFADADGNGVGDFKGLTAKLDYLNDGNDATTTDLGITGIWLMPIFPSQTYHGYNVDDYYGINPEYGTMEDFTAFTTAAAERGISVIIDMTHNHSSLFTEWFMDSRNPNSPYRSWYRWISADDSRYNLSQRIWGHNVWNKVGESYYSGIFESGMPDFNLRTPAVREEFKKIAKFWMDKGVAGFRLDAAGHIFNAAKIPAGEAGQELAIEWWKEFVGYTKTVKADAFNVGEVWEPVNTRAQFMRGLDSTFHFDLGTKIVDTIRTGDAGANNIAHSLYGAYETYAATAPGYVDSPFLTNHDQNRIGGILRGDPAQLKLAGAIYMLTEGVPFMYYGEEIGLNGAKPDEQIRTPMLWNAPGKDNLQTTWIESRYNKNTLPVSVQVRDSASLQTFYRRLIRVKTAHPALFKGRMRPLDTEAAEILSWVMESPEEKAFVMHNISPDPVEVTLPLESMPLVFSTYEGVIEQNGKVTLPGRCSVVFATRK